VRNLQTFIRDTIRKPPVLFPLLAVFHIGMTVYVIYADLLDKHLWAQVLWMLAFSFFWLFICDLRKWAAMGYLILTSIDVILYFIMHSEKSIYVSNMFLLDVLFSFFIFLFYKKFE